MANYYQLAVGSGKNESFDFDIVNIAERSGIKALTIYNSIRILMREGYIHLSDSLHQPSKLKIKVNQSELYYFEVANPKFEFLLKTMLRSYADLFESYVRFNEYQLARRCNMDVKEMVNQLKYLDNIGLIDYLPSNDKAQIIYLSERIPRQNLSLSYESYAALRERQGERINSMIHYVEADRCRNRLLLEYFGEKETEDCGHCDVCLKKKGKPDMQHIESRIIELLSGGPKALDFIRSQFKVHEEDDLLQAMRFLSNEGKLERKDDKWLLSR